MNKDRLKCIISGLTCYELTGLEKQFVQSVEEYFNQTHLLTDQQESILEGLAQFQSFDFFSIPKPFERGIFWPDERNRFAVV